MSYTMTSNLSGFPEGSYMMPGGTAAAAAMNGASAFQPFAPSGTNVVMGGSTNNMMYGMPTTTTTSYGMPTTTSYGVMPPSTTTTYAMPTTTTTYAGPTTTSYLPAGSSSNYYPMGSATRTTSYIPPASSYYPGGGATTTTSYGAAAGPTTSYYPQHQGSTSYMPAAAAGSYATTSMMMPPPQQSIRYHHPHAHNNPYATSTSGGSPGMMMSSMMQQQPGMGSATRYSTTSPGYPYQTSTAVASSSAMGPPQWHQGRIYYPPGTDYVTPGTHLRGGMYPMYDTSAVPTFEAPIVFNNDGTQAGGGGVYASGLATAGWADGYNDQDMMMEVQNRGLDAIDDNDIVKPQGTGRSGNRSRSTKAKKGCC